MTFFDLIRNTFGGQDIKEEPAYTPPEEVNDTPFSTHNMVACSDAELNSLVFPHLKAIEQMHERHPMSNVGGVNKGEMANDAMVVGAGDNAFDIKQVFSLSNSRVPDILMGWYTRQGFISYQACATMAQHWLINKACEAPPRDASRNGWKLTADDNVDEKLLEDLQDKDNKYKLAENVLQYSKMTRVFGIRIAIFKVESDDPKYYEKKFNVDAIKKGSYQGIAQVDPYWCVPELRAQDIANPASITFYEPEYWIIGGVRYHKSHLSVLRFAEVPDILKPAYLYGGVSLVQMLYERVYCAERSANEAPQLLMTKRMNVSKVDLKRIVTDPVVFRQRIEYGAFLRDNYGEKFIGKDEEYTQHETSLADVDAVIMSQYQLVASIANMPATRLIEVQPKGFNSAGDNEQRNYRQALKSIQIHEMDQLLEKHYMILARSDHGVSTDTIRVKWNSTDDPTSVEIAALNKQRAEYYSALQDTGAVSAEDIAEALNHDDDSGFSGLRPDPDQSLEELMAADAGWKEEDHPREKDGKFGTGSSSGEKQVSETPKITTAFYEEEGARENIRSDSEKLKGILEEMGAEVKLQHSGSAFGPSSYLDVSDPQTGRFLRQIRMSGHSKGNPANAQGVLNVSGEQGINEIIELFKHIRGKGLVSGWVPPEERKKQDIAGEAEKRKKHLPDLKEAKELQSSGGQLKSKHRYALKLEEEGFFDK